MKYALIKPILFRLDPEFSHTFSLKAIKLLNHVHLLRSAVTVPSTPTTVFGLQFTNPVGLAAGLDKNGDYLDALGVLGFGFIEIGTVTPKPQSGNPKPRLFRSVEDEAIINRMGFNNKGVDYLVNKVRQSLYQGILGINIGKNGSTPLENAVDDYAYCLRKVYPLANYVTVNISSPNTPGLRQLQSIDYLFDLLQALKNLQNELANHHHKYVPLVIKVAPDLTVEEITSMSRVFLETKIDGVIATNTSLSRDNLQNSLIAQEAGGLSGAPLFDKATTILSAFHQQLSNLPLIASGGIMSGEQAKQKIDAGAKLVQLYTGLIFKGPALINNCVSFTN